MFLLRKKYFLLITLLVAAVILAGTWWFFSRGQRMPVQVSSSPAVNPAASSTSSTQATSTAGTKTYRNTEWGFEFRYPQDFVLRENTFGNYYSQFNLDVVVKEGQYFAPFFLVNVVLPEFAERSFRGVEKTTSAITIDRVSGIKYQYEFEGQQETAIVLPLGKNKIILALENQQYEDVFNQILASFKFLK